MSTRFYDVSLMVPGGEMVTYQVQANTRSWAARRARTHLRAMYGPYVARKATVIDIQPVRR